MASELSKQNFADDLAELRSLEEASRWELVEKGDLELWATVAPEGHSEKYIARLHWIEYPGSEPASVKFVSASGQADDPKAWPNAQGFRPANLDICANWTREGFNLHPEWRGDARFRWTTDGNVLLKSLRYLQHMLDTTYSGRFGG